MKPTNENVFDKWMDGGGIFTALNSFNVPWKNDIQPILLDLEYYGNYAGSKTVSPLVAKMLKKDGTDVLVNSRIIQLATTIYNINGKRWDKLWGTMNYDYDPISNYDMVETESTSGTNNDTKRNTGTQTDVSNGSETTTRTGSQETTTSSTVEGTAKGTNEDRIFGFNSTESVGDRDGITNATTSNKVRGGDTKTDDFTDEKTDDLSHIRTDNLTETTTGTTASTRTLTRKGNIGVTTSQQMIESERTLWMWRIFYDVVFPDVDRVLSIPLYSDGFTYNEYSSTSGGGGGGGDTTEIINRLDALSAKVDSNTGTLSANIRGVDNKVNVLQSSVNNLQTSVSGINTKIDTNTASINLSINALRVSTFEAIDGVTTRQY